jgi:hypothetical protein
MDDVSVDKFECDKMADSHLVRQCIPNVLEAIGSHIQDGGFTQ